MRNVSSVTWVVFIFLVSVAMEVASWLVSGFSGASAFRLFLIVALFAMLLKGVRFVRYVMGAIYALSSVLAISLAFQARAHPGLAAAFLCRAGNVRFVAARRRQRDAAEKDDPVNGLAVLIPIALGLGLLGLAAFFWSLRRGQFDDLDGAALRIFVEDEEDRAA